MTTVLRVGFVARIAKPLLSTQCALPAALTQKCNISGRLMRGGPRIPKCPPYPYKEKGYGIIQSFFDKTSKRIDENSKMICVEGPIGAGKSKFAQELAEELDMLYVPDATLDLFYINSYGYDLRKLDPYVPKSTRSFDVTNFCRDPHHRLAGQFQIRMYLLRFEQYLDSLAHILSTGQGVVMERSPYSDVVFMEAMFKSGFISAGVRSVYNEIVENTIHELMQPHLVVYLDCPVEAVKNRIKARNIDYEVNSKVFSDKYLSDIEELYKQLFLRKISDHAEILIYDWTAGGETEVVVEDIERIDFAKFEIDQHNKKMKDWRFPLESMWTEARIKYCNGKPYIMAYFNVPRFDVPELVHDAEDLAQWREVWNNAPGMKYRPGYNEDMGDSGLLLKNKMLARERPF